MTTTAEQVESPSTSTLPPPSALLLPFSRVKRIMKEDHQVDKIAQDAVIAVAAATEAFLVDLSSKAGLRMKQEQRKTLQYKDLSKPLSILNPSVYERAVRRHHSR